MGILEVFNAVMDVIKHNYRIKDDKPELEIISEELENKISLIKDTKNPLMSFKEISTNKSLEAFFDKYADLMVDDLPHSADFKLLFKRTAQTLPARDVMDMANHITQNVTFEKAIKINDCQSEQAALGLYHLAQECSVENKTELYSILDNTVLDDCLQSCNKMNIAMFVSEIFKGIETGEALNILKNSVAWINVEYSDSLYDQLDDFDHRLIPAMDYTKGSPNNSINPNSHGIR